MTIGDSPSCGRTASPGGAIVIGVLNKQNTFKQLSNSTKTKQKKTAGRRSSTQTTPTIYTIFITSMLVFFVLFVTSYIYIEH